MLYLTNSENSLEKIEIATVTLNKETLLYLISSFM